MTTSGATRISSSAWRGCCRLVEQLRRGVAGVADLLYPAECALCGASVEWGAVVCSACEHALPRVAGAACVVCGEPLSSSSLDLCSRCGTRVRAFESALALGPYEGSLRGLLLRFKFRRERAVGRWLAGKLAARCIASGMAVDAVTHVPMTASEERARGFNPSRVLARGVARRLGVPERRLLTKIRATPPQRSLSARERETNLSGAFRAVRSGRGVVLLIDDLLTTGATADECARALRGVGFDRVVVAAVSRA